MGACGAKVADGDEEWGSLRMRGSDGRKTEQKAWKVPRKSPHRAIEKQGWGSGKKRQEDGTVQDKGQVSQCFPLSQAHAPSDLDADAHPPLSCPRRHSS